jgi:hypothetical protein
MNRFLRSIALVGRRPGPRAPAAALAALLAGCARPLPPPAPAATSPAEGAPPPAGPASPARPDASTSARPSESTAVVARPSDLENVAGAWAGTLTYRDYTTGLPKVIKVEAVGSVAGRAATLHLRYPDEPGHEGAFALSLDAEGRRVGGLALVERSAPAGGPVRLVLEERGRDGNDGRPATFRHVVALAGDSLTVTKLVKFDDEATFFERNAYALRRKPGAPAWR